MQHKNKIILNVAFLITTFAFSNLNAASASRLKSDMDKVFGTISTQDNLYKSNWNA